MNYILTKHILNSERQSKELAKKIASQINKGSVIAFSGELGSGKTFLCRHIIAYLYGKKIRVISPSFNLLQIYQTPSFYIYHFDLYRIKFFEETYELGIEEALYNDNICLIEWPEIVNDILPQNTLLVKIFINKNTKDNRLVTIDKIQ